jgi:hypothetical protein
MSNKINYVLFRQFQINRIDHLKNENKLLTNGEFFSLFQIALDIYESDACKGEISGHECFKCTQIYTSCTKYIRFYKLALNCLIAFLRKVSTEYEISMLNKMVNKDNFETLLMFVIYKILKEAIQNNCFYINEDLETLYKNFDKCYPFFKNFPSDEASFFVNLAEFIMSKKHVAKHLRCNCNKKKCIFTGLKSFWLILIANFDEYCVNNSPDTKKLVIIQDILQSITYKKPKKLSFCYIDQKINKKEIDDLELYNEEYTIETFENSHYSRFDF